MEPIQIVQSYFDRVYVDFEVDAVRELCADPYRRHEAGNLDVLDHEQNVERVNRAINGACSPGGERFTMTIRQLSGDDHTVTAVFDFTAPDGSPMAAADTPMETIAGQIRMCGIEIFRFTDGLITDVWVSSLMPGHWG